MNEIFNKKRRYLLLGYLFGYVVQIIVLGVPSWEYLLPIRVFPLLFVGPFGYALYNISIKGGIFEGYKNSMKYLLIAILIEIVVLLINMIFLTPIFNIDIWPYVGFPLE